MFCNISPMTEPKIKFYIEVKGPKINSPDDLAQAKAEVDQKIAAITSFFGI